jgi:hypothetical protein
MELLLIIAMYFIPTVVAACRGKRNTLAIFATNVLLGWTVIGWIAALIWSLTADAPSVVMNNNLAEGAAQKTPFAKFVDQLKLPQGEDHSESCAVIDQQRDISGKARAEPRGGSYQMKAILTVLFLLLVAMLIVVARKVGLQKGERQAATQQAAVMEAMVPKPAPTTTAPVERTKWDYSELTDEMTGAKTKLACVESTNSLAFGFPYDGGSTGTLCLREKGSKRDAYVYVSKGQFVCTGYYGCPIQLKFDDGQARHFDAEESDSGDSDILFIMGYGPLLASTRKAKHLKVQAMFFQEGKRVLEFDVAGLKWD